MIPGLPQLLEDVKALEDHARACRSGGQERMVLLTREEADVIESFRRFKAQSTISTGAHHVAGPDEHKEKGQRFPALLRRRGTDCG